MPATLRPDRGRRAVGRPVSDDAGAALAKADRDKAGLVAVGAKDRLVAVFEKGPAFRPMRASWRGSRPRSAPSGCHSRRGSGRRSCRCRTSRRGAGCSRRSCGASPIGRASNKGRSCCWPTSGAAAALSPAAPRSAKRLRARCRRRPPADHRRPTDAATAAGHPSGRAGCATRNGASASVVTTQGDTVEPKFLPRNGPSGCDSQPCTSRADQSLTRPSPTM